MRMNFRHLAPIRRGSLVAVVLAAGPLARAQVVVAEDLAVTTPVLEDLGRAVALSGDRLAVGVPSVSQVRIHRFGPTLQLEAVLPGTPGDFFGYSIALEGDLIAVGAMRESGFVADEGLVHVLAHNGTLWSPQALLRPALAVPAIEFGRSVALDGDLLAVGAPSNATHAGLVDGAVEVFERGSGGWTPVFSARDAFPFGRAVAIQGDRLVVDAGPQLVVFRRVAGTWALAQTLPAPGGSIRRTLALDGDLLATGSPLVSLPGAPGLGLVRVFREAAGVWSEEAQIAPPYPAGEIAFGWGVALDAGRLLVGSWISSPPLPTQGAGHLYEHGAGAWEHRAHLIRSAPLGGVGAFSVAMQGDRAVLGSSGAAPAVLIYGVPRTVGSQLCAGSGASVPCPCGNVSSHLPTSGCVNGRALDFGATLRASGSPSLTSDDLEVALEFALPGQPLALFAGDQPVQGGQGLPFGDGLSCVGGSVQRLGTAFGRVWTGGAAWGSVLGGVAGAAPGQTRYFQVWYRDPGASPCGSGFNTSNALALTLEP